MKILLKAIFFHLLRTFVFAFNLAAFAAAGAGAAEAALEQHPLNGVWRPDLAASAEKAPLPDRLPQDLGNLSLVVDTEAGKLLLSWADGAQQEKDFIIASSGEKIYRLTIAGNSGQVTLDASQEDELLMEEDGNFLVFRRAPSADVPPAID